MVSGEVNIRIARYMIARDLQSTPTDRLAVRACWEHILPSTILLSCLWLYIFIQSGYYTRWLITHYSKQTLCSSIILSQYFFISIWWCELRTNEGRAFYRINELFIGNCCYTATTSLLHSLSLFSYVVEIKSYLLVFFFYFNLLSLLMLSR